MSQTYPNSFTTAFNYTMHHEIGNATDGGYVNDPRDPGGETKYGLSKRANPDLDIAALTREDAKWVYYRRYWTPLKLNNVEHLSLAVELFDTAVNTGVDTAARIAQRCINLLNRREGWDRIAVDGMVGPVTLAYLNRWGRKDEEALLALLNIKQGIRYLNIIRHNPQMIYALRSWARRCLPPNLPR